ncbi:hypothetical protein PG989_004751 [Apiospora arundinis]
MDFIACMTLCLVQVLLANNLSTTRTDNSQSARTAVELFLGQYLLLKFYRVFLYHRYFSPFRHLPGPKDSHFLFGQTLKLFQTESPTELYVQWVKQWPDAPLIRYLGAFNSEVLVVNSLAAYKDFLQTNCYSFVKPSWWHKVTRTIVGDGLLVMEGDEHRAHKKMLSGILSAPSVKKLEPVVWEKAKEVGLLFDSAIASNPDEETGVVESSDTFSKFTLDIMARVTLGLELNNLGSTAETYRQGKPESRSSIKSSEPKGYTFHEAYLALFGQSTFGNFLSFVNAFLPIRWLPVEANLRYLRGADWLQLTLSSIIRERKRDVMRASETGGYEKQNSRDMLTFLVEETLPGGPAEGIKENHFLGHILQLMVGGVDTTANMLAWSSYVLANHHDIQDKLRREILNFLARVSEPTYADINTLPYLNGFVKELLRVYSPGTTIYRQAIEDVVLDGVLVPRGTMVEATWAMPMTNPQVWGDDADEVRPERWEHLTPTQKSPYAFPAFSGGPRMCPGKNLAYVEMKVILVEIMRQYRFLRVVTQPKLHNPSLILHAHELEVSVERIK